MSLLEEGREKDEKAQEQSNGKGIREDLSLGSAHKVQKGTLPRNQMIPQACEAGRAAISCPFLQGGRDTGSARFIDLPKVPKLIKRATMKTQVL